MVASRRPPAGTWRPRCGASPGGRHGLGPSPSIRIKPGATLVRSWRGQTHTVQVLDGGFEYQGEHFASLSADRAAHHRGALVRPALLWPAAAQARPGAGEGRCALSGVSARRPDPSAPPRTPPLRHLHPQVHRGGAGAGVQLPRCPARGLRGLHPQPAPRGLDLLPDRYDDGGFSGGTMDRPALQQLLADIDAGQVDLVVVYKVDRLTRSLADFAKIVEVLDAHGASFVSVTQQFNTTHQHGPADAEHAALLRPVRARGHRRAHPRQDRGLQAQGHVDGRHGAARLRGAATASWSSTRPRPRRCGTSSELPRALSMRPEFSSEARFEISPGKLPVISRCWDLASSLSVAGRGA